MLDTVTVWFPTSPTPKQLSHWVSNPKIFPNGRRISKFYQNPRVNETATATFVYYPPNLPSYKDPRLSMEVSLSRVLYGDNLQTIYTGVSLNEHRRNEMTTFNDANKPSKKYKWRTITFRIGEEEHEQIINLASYEGKAVPAFVSELIAEAIQSRMDLVNGPHETVKVKVFKARSKVREHQRRIEDLAEIRSSLTEEVFFGYCQELGISPDEVLEIVPPGGTGTKLERCCIFLRVLFMDRPDGLPANRVLEIAQSEGFGVNLTRDAASKNGFETKWFEVDGKRTSFWIPVRG